MRRHRDECCRASVVVNDRERTSPECAVRGKVASKIHTIQRSVEMVPFEIFDKGDRMILMPSHRYRILEEMGIAGGEDAALDSKADDHRP